MKRAFIFLSVVCSVNLKGVPSFSASIEDGGEASFILVVENPQKEKLHLVVRHTQFGLVSDTTIHSAKLRCRYNLQQVEDGQYEMEISNGREAILKRFVMETMTKVERRIVSSR